MWMRMMYETRLFAAKFFWFNGARLKVEDRIVCGRAKLNSLGRAHKLRAYFKLKFKRENFQTQHRERFARDIPK